MNKSKVVIVGGGPVGLVTAYLLCQHQIYVDVIESTKSPHKDPRAFGIQPSTLEILADYPVIGPILDKGYKIHHMEILDGDTNNCVVRCSFSLLEKETRHPYHLSIDQNVLCDILLAALKKNTYFKIHYESHATNITQNSAGIHVQINNKVTPIVADFLCGCDGAHSHIRQEILACKLKIEKYQHKFFSFDIAHYDPRWIFPSYTGYAFILGSDLYHTALFQLTEHSSRLVFHFADGDESTPAGQQQIDTTRKKLFDYCPKSSLKNIKITRHVCYDTYRAVSSSFGQGRVFIAGDAAHLNSPVGAMGLNSGIHDGYFFASAVLAFVHDHDENALHDYAQKRRYWVIENSLKLSDQNYQDVTKRDNLDLVIKKYKQLEENSEAMHDYLRHHTMLNVLDQQRRLCDRSYAKR